jgi:hypothetical protein
LTTVGEALAVRVGVATMIHGVCVGWASATRSAPGVAVTTMIHGVWVGGGIVGCGVVPQPARTPANTANRANNANIFFIS